VVAKVRERFNLRKLNDLEVRKQYQIAITNRFAALENVSDDEDINRAWESIKDNIKTSAKESHGLEIGTVYHRHLVSFPQYPRKCSQHRRLSQ
jgi:hypothetical protein